MLGRSRDTPSREELLEQQQQQQRDAEERQAAQQLAAQAAQQGAPGDDGYWEVIGDPDIARELAADDEHLADFLATELSDKFALGNITYPDWESWQWQIENEFWVMKNEFQRNPKLDDIDVATMYGERRPELTNERARRLRSAGQVKKMMTSLSIGSRGLRSGTEIHAVAKTEQADTQDEDSGGLLSRTKQKLV